jgi:hypothetical protein
MIICNWHLSYSKYLVNFNIPLIMNLNFDIVTKYYLILF